jgi:hypothetical protein
MSNEQPISELPEEAHGEGTAERPHVIEVEGLQSAERPLRELFRDVAFAVVQEDPQAESWRIPESRFREVATVDGSLRDGFEEDLEKYLTIQLPAGGFSVVREGEDIIITPER